MKTLLVAVAAILSVYISSHLYAAPVTFDDKADFLNYTGAIAKDPIPNMGLTPIAYSKRLGDMEYTSQSSYMYMVDYYTPYIGNEIALSGAEHLDISIDDAVYAMGFDFVDPSTSTTFSVTLKNNGTEVGSFSFSRPTDALTFVGVSNDTAFDLMEIRDLSGDGADEFFGQFYASAAAATSIPEPATLMLLMLSIFGLRRYLKK